MAISSYPFSSLQMMIFLTVSFLKTMKNEPIKQEKDAMNRSTFFDRISFSITQRITEHRQVAIRKDIMNPFRFVNHSLKKRKLFEHLNHLRIQRASIATIQTIRSFGDIIFRIGKSTIRTILMIFVLREEIPRARTLYFYRMIELSYINASQMNLLIRLRKNRGKVMQRSELLKIELTEKISDGMVRIIWQMQITQTDRILLICLFSKGKKTDRVVASCKMSRIRPI